MNFKETSFVLLTAILFYWHFCSGTVSEERLEKDIGHKVVVLCGASSGIGEEVAYHLAKKRAKLLLVARRRSRLVQVKEKSLELGSPQVEIFPFDFSDAANSRAVIDWTLKVFGNIDYLILNHGSMTSGLFLQFPKHQKPSFVERIFNINIFSNIQLAVAALPHLEKSKGHIFVTSSILGESPTLTMSLYSSTKHALNGFFYSLQQELIAKGSNVTITIGAFGPIRTNDNEAFITQVEKSSPSFLTGNATKCAELITNAMVLRPRTVTYPKLTGFLMRVGWYFNPWAQELTGYAMLGGMGYEEHKSESDSLHAKAAATNFQDGSF